VWYGRYRLPTWFGCLVCTAKSAPRFCSSDPGAGQPRRMSRNPCSFETDASDTRPRRDVGGGVRIHSGAPSQVSGRQRPGQGVPKSEQRRALARGNPYETARGTRATTSCVLMGTRRAANANRELPLRSADARCRRHRTPLEAPAANCSRSGGDQGDDALAVGRCSRHSVTRGSTQRLCRPQSQPRCGRPPARGDRRLPGHRRVAES